MPRAYHFISLQHGLDDLRQRHLKISRLDDLNDPFELWAIATRSPCPTSPQRHKERNGKAVWPIMLQPGLA
jgi:hypothetical protein